jgi:cohesin loading factor subunit SCC2
MIGAPRGVNINELVGDTAGFAESGVASAVVQRYLSGILEAALSPHEGVQRIAMDIVSFTVRQGLAHPIQVSKGGPPMASD